MCKTKTRKGIKNKYLFLFGSTAFTDATIFKTKYTANTNPNIVKNILFTNPKIIPSRITITNNGGIKCRNFNE